MFDRVELQNDKAGQSGPVDLVITGTKGELNTREIRVSRFADAEVRAFSAGEEIGQATITAFPDSGDGVVVEGIPIVADSPTTAYINADGVSGRGELDPTFTVPTPSPGEPLILATLPAGGDLSRAAKLNEFDYLIRARINEGVVVNPKTGGTYTLDGTMISVDPDSGGADDGTGSPPKTATFSQDTTIVAELPPASCSEDFFFERPPLARYFYIRNDNIGHEDGPFAVLGYPNPDGHQVVDLQSLGIYDDTETYLGSMGGTWVSPGACPFYSYQGDMQTFVDGILTPHPDPEPGVCGHGCPAWDDNTPNQPPTVEVDNPNWVVEAGTVAWFFVTYTDELPNQINGGFSSSGVSFCFTDFAYDGFLAVRCAPNVQVRGTFNGAVQVFDSSLSSERIPVTLTVTPPSETDPQQVAAQNQTISQRDGLNIPLAASDPDGDDPLVFSMFPPWPGCSLADRGDNTGNLYCASGAFKRSHYPFVVTVTDASGEYSQQKIDVTVTEENVAPVLENPGDMNVRVNDPARSVRFFAFDENGDIENGFQNDGLNFGVSGVEECVISAFGTAGGNSIRYELQFGCYFTSGQEGTYPVTVTATDTGVPPLSDQVSFNVIVVGEEYNSAPVFAALADRSIAIDQIANLKVQAIDPEGDGITLTVTGNPPSCNLFDNGDGSGYLQCYPDNDAGVWTLLFTATDSRGAQSTATATLTVRDTNNEAPEFIVLVDRHVYAFDPVEIFVGAIDETPESVTLSLVSGPPSGCFFEDLGSGTGVLSCDSIGLEAIGGPQPRVRAFDGELESFYDIPLQVAERPAINPVAPVETDEGSTVSIPLIATGGFGSLTYGVAAPTPTFCGFPDETVSAAQCSTIEGDAGDYTIRVIATDELGTDAQQDISFTVRQVPQLTATKRAVIADDNGDGVMNIGEFIDYVVKITNTGDTTLPGAVFVDPLMDGQALRIEESLVTSSSSLRPGEFPFEFVTNNRGTLREERVLLVYLGDLASGEVVTISFPGYIDTARVLPGPSFGVVNQGSVDVSGFAAVPTDDPTTPEVGDATGTLVYYPNSQPSFSPIADQEVAIGQDVEIPFNVIDDDPWDTPNLVITAENLTASCEVIYFGNGNGVIRCTDVQIDSNVNPALPVTLTVTDTGGSIDRTSFNLSIFDPNAPSVPPQLTATKKAALEDTNNDGDADEGEFIKYTVTISNDGPDSAFDVSLYDPIGYFAFDEGGYEALLDTNYEITARTESGAAVGEPYFGDEFGPGRVELIVDIPELPSGDTAIIEFRTRVIDIEPTEYDGYVENQAFISARGLAEGEEIRTDDPATPEIVGDSTITKASEPAPEVVATKVGSIVDIYGNGVFDDGDGIEFTVTVRNDGEGTAKGVVFVDTFQESATNDPYYIAFDDSVAVTTTFGALVAEPDPVTGLGDLVVSIGDLAPGQKAEIKFRAFVPRVLFTGREIGYVANQGLVTGSNIPDTKTDDTAEPGDDDPTEFVVRNPRATLAATKSGAPVDLNMNGRLDVGEPVDFLITISALGDAGAEEVEFEDPLPGLGALLSGYGFAFDSSVEPVISGPFLNGDVWFDSEKSALKGKVDYVPGNTEITVYFRATVIDTDAEADSEGRVENQAYVEATNAFSVRTDDPSTAEDQDATAFDVKGTRANQPPTIGIFDSPLRGYFGQPAEARFIAIDETPDLISWSYSDPIEGCGIVQDPPVGAEVTFRCETTPELQDGGPIVVTGTDVFGATDSKVLFILAGEPPSIEPIPVQHTNPNAPIEIPVAYSGGFSPRVSLGENAPTFCSTTGSGNVLCIPGSGDFGQFVFDIIVTDQVGTTARTTVTLNVAQPPRFVERPDGFDVYIGEKSTLQLVVDDDLPESLAFSVTGLPPWCGISRVPSDPRILNIDCEAPLERRSEPPTTVTVTDGDGLDDTLVIEIWAVQPVGIQADVPRAVDEGQQATFVVGILAGSPPYDVGPGYLGLPPWCELIPQTQEQWLLVCNPPAGSAKVYELPVVVADSNGRTAERSFTLYVRDPAAPPSSLLVIEKRAFDPDTSLTLGPWSIPLRRGDAVGIELIITNIGNAPAVDLGSIQDLFSSSTGSRRRYQDLVDGVQLPQSDPDWQCRFPGGGGRFTICTNNAGTDTLAPGDSIRILTQHRIAEELATLEQDEVCDIATVRWENGTRVARSQRVCVPVRRPDASFLDVNKTAILTESDYLDNVPEVVRSAAPFESLGQISDAPGPGDRTIWHLQVTNTGSRTALDLQFVEDRSDYVWPTRRVIPNFENFEAIVIPPGWDCTDVGGKLVRCTPNDTSNTLAPDESLDFLFAFDITDDRPWPSDSEVCNAGSVRWEGNRLAKNGGEDCIPVNSPGVAALEVRKTLIDGITGEPATIPVGGYRPGDLLDFRVEVSNRGPVAAVDLGTLVDSGHIPTAPAGQRFLGFQSGGRLSAPDEWRCRFIRGAQRLECRPPRNTNLGPGETLEFVFRMRLNDPIPGANVDSLCNRAGITWRDGLAAGEACFPVNQVP